MNELSETTAPTSHFRVWRRVNDSVANIFGINWLQEGSVNRVGESHETSFDFDGCGGDFGSGNL
jgi:hypothetical protein